MRRPQFSLKTLLWLTLSAALACAAGRMAERLYLGHAIATTRAELDECREELKGEIYCGVMRASLHLEASELEKKLRALEARK